MFRIAHLVSRWILLSSIILALTQCIQFQKSPLDPNSPFSQLWLMNQIGLLSTPTTSTSRAPIPSVFTSFRSEDSSLTTRTGFVSFDPIAQTPRFTLYPINTYPTSYPLVGSDDAFKIVTEPINEVGYIYFKESIFNALTSVNEFFHVVLKINLRTGAVLGRNSILYFNGVSLGEEGESYPAGFLYSSKKNRIFLVTSPKASVTTRLFFLHVFDPVTLQRISRTPINIGTLNMNYMNGIAADGAILDDRGDRIILPINRLNSSFGYDAFVQFVSTNEPYNSLQSDVSTVYLNTRNYHTMEAFSPIFDESKNELVFFSYTFPTSSIIRFYYFNLSNSNLRTIDSPHSHTGNNAFYNMFWNPSNRRILVKRRDSINNQYFIYDDSGLTDGLQITIPVNSTLDRYPNALVTTNNRMFYHKDTGNAMTPVRFNIGFLDQANRTNSPDISVFQDTSLVTPTYTGMGTFYVK